jgi:hypothetical protein
VSTDSKHNLTRRQHVFLSSISENAKQATEDGKTELSDDEAEVAEENIDGNVEAGEKDAGNLNHSDDDSTDELSA